MSKDSLQMKTSNYLDKDSNNGWEWHNDGEKVVIVTRHDHPKEHEHRADVTDVPIGEMVENPDPIIGNAHRKSSHYYKDGTVKPPKIENKGKDTENMSNKGHQAFCDSLNPANYGNGNMPQNTGSKVVPKATAKDDGGRDIGDEGPGSLGREPGHKGGNNSNNNVSNMRASMKANSSSNTTGKSSNGLSVTSGKGNAGNISTGGHGSNGGIGSTGGGHGSNGGAGGGHGGSGGSGGGHGGNGGTGGGHGGH